MRPAILSLSLFLFACGAETADVTPEPAPEPAPEAEPAPAEGDAVAEAEPPVEGEIVGDHDEAEQGKEIAIHDCSVLELEEQIEVSFTVPAEGGPVVVNHFVMPAGKEVMTAKAKWDDEAWNLSLTMGKGDSPVGAAEHFEVARLMILASDVDANQTTFTADQRWYLALESKGPQAAGETITLQVRGQACMQEINEPGPDPVGAEPDANYIEGAPEEGARPVELTPGEPADEAAPAE